MNSIRVPQLAWYQPGELVLPLPDNWQVEVCHMAGYNRSALSPEEIQHAITHPIGQPPIRELARGKREVVIIFDDMTRVTRLAEIVHVVLAELADAGIPDRHIRFIMSLGCHGARDRRDFARKLGEDVLARFPVYNHNPFANCTYVGTTATYGTKVYINDEVMSCDLKIALGSVVPHPMNGFGAGGKAILPGVASFETIEHNHRKYYQGRQQGVPGGMGILEGNPMVADLDEAATIAGLDVLVNCIVNSRGETVAVFAGALKPAYAAAVAEARSHYLTPTVVDRDIVIANAFAKANEAFIGCAIAYPALKATGGDVVLIGNTPEGQVVHYLLGPFGDKSHGPLWREAVLPPQVNRLIIFTEYPDLASRGWFADSEKVLFLHKWVDVLRVLQSAHGQGTRVVVYPNADIQYCR